MNNRADTVLFTGCASVFMKSIAEKFVRDGKYLIICAEKENADILAFIAHMRSIGQADAVFTDLSVEQNCQKLADQTESDYGGIDILINAGRKKKEEKSILETDPDEFRETIETNLMGPIYLSYYVSQKMMSRNKGVIMNLSSAGGLLATGTDYGFHASMSSLNLVTKTTSKALYPYGVRVMSVIPDPMLEDDHYAQTADGMKKCADLADLMLFLSTPQAGALNSTTVVADNGFTSWR